MLRVFFLAHQEDEKSLLLLTQALVCPQRAQRVFKHWSCAVDLQRRDLPSDEPEPQLLQLSGHPPECHPMY